MVTASSQPGQPRHDDALATIAASSAIEQFLGLLHAGAPFEIRALAVPRMGTVSGYYCDAHRAAHDVANKLARSGAEGVYVTLNPINPIVMARADERLREYAKHTTSDDEIVRRRWLPLDFDPCRPSGISATEEEAQAALVRAQIAREELGARGWPEPLVVASGNGVQMLYRVDLDNDEESRVLIRRALQGLARRYDDARVCLDTSTFNAARMTKLVGTIARKGDATPERPHRRAMLLSAPTGPLEIVGLEALEALASVAASSQTGHPTQTSDTRKSYALTRDHPDERARRTDAASHIADLRQWLDARNVIYRTREGKDAHAGACIFELERCPWTPGDHAHPWKAWALQRADGRIAAGCHAEKCQGRGFRELREALEPDWRTIPVPEPVTAPRRESLASRRDDDDEHSDDDDDPLGEAPGGDRTAPYRRSARGLWLIRHDREGRPYAQPLTNFTAQIVGDTVEDDGAETRRAFELEATLCAGAPQRRAPRRFQLPAERFSAMTWPTEQLGAAAILYPGQSAREHARVAIQLFSAAAPERRVFTHTGWRQLDGAWLYLHAEGAIGAAGTCADIAVALAGDLARYALPALPTPGSPDDDMQQPRIREAVHASLRLLEVAPIAVTAPLFAAIWRAALGETDFTPHLTGPTGEGKSELAALCQQHYGATMDARHLPASWASTGNALEAQAFHTKDALLVVDDFIPTGSAVDAARLHREADRVLRAQGNHSGRGRLRADTTARPAKPPRGMILSTGEDIPRGASLRARMLVIEHAPGTLDWRRLQVCQRDAADGRYALALAAFLRWVAGHYEEVQARLRPQAARAAFELSDLAGPLERTEQPGNGMRHMRTNDSVAQLIAGMRVFAEFACAAQALTAEQASALCERIAQALLRVAERQTSLHAQGEPTQRFLTLLAAAIASGEAHLANLVGERPAGAAPWGWRATGRGDLGDGFEWTAWSPIGKKVGWLNGDDLYLLPDAAYAAAQRVGQASGDGLSVTPGTLWKRLHERGLLVSRDASRQTLKVRITAEGHRPSVLHLSARALSGLSDDPNPTNPTSQPSDARAGRVAWSGMDSSDAWRPDDASGAQAQQHGPADDVVGLVGFTADESAIADEALTTGVAPWSDAARNPTTIPTNDPTTQADQPPDQLAEQRGAVVALAARLGWPALFIAPHLRVSDERGWRSVAHPDSPAADVAHALAALQALQHQVAALDVPEQH